MQQFYTLHTCIKVKMYWLSSILPASIKARLPAQAEAIDDDPVEEMRGVSTIKL